MTRKTVKIDPTRLLGFRLEALTGAKCGQKIGTKPREFVNARAMLGGKPRFG